MLMGQHASGGRSLGYSRFMQADPIGVADGLNLYGYVGGDPVNRTDPSGTCDVEPCNGLVIEGRYWINASGILSGRGGIGGLGSYPREDNGGGGIPGIPRLNLPPICSNVSRSGNKITVGTPVQFYYGDYPTTDINPANLASNLDANYYLYLMNTGRFNAFIGPYAVSVQMTRGFGGMTAFLGNPRIGGEAANTHYLYLTQPTGYPARDSLLVDHGLGHAFGSPHSESVFGRSLGNLMDQNPSGAARSMPTADHVEDLITTCHLEGE